MQKLFPRYVYKPLLPAHIIACLLLAGCFMGCHSRPKSISFYYWKTVFTLDTLEKKTLLNNQVQTLYTRYFDVDRAPEDSFPHPVAPISLDSSIDRWHPIPKKFSLTVTGRSGPAVPDFTAWTSFANLKRYSNTQFYKDVIAECGYFRMYINP